MCNIRCKCTLFPFDVDHNHTTKVVTMSLSAHIVHICKVTHTYKVMYNLEQLVTKSYVYDLEVINKLCIMFHGDFTNGGCVIFNTADCVCCNSCGHSILLPGCIHVDVNGRCSDVHKTEESL